MKRLEVSGAVRPIYGSLGAKRLILVCKQSCACVVQYSKSKGKVIPLRGRCGPEIG